MTTIKGMNVSKIGKCGVLQSHPSEDAFSD